MRPRRSLSVATGVAVAVALAGWWAFAVLTSAPHAPTSGDDDTAITVSESTIGRMLSVSIAVVRQTERLAVNHLAGVVTEVEDGGLLDNGDTAYVVGGTPVRVIEAATPFWRALGPDVNGEDTAALQEALIDLGYFEGTADGEFRWGTEAAVRQWQEDLSQEPTGVIVLGELIAVPETPAHIELGEDLQRGNLLGGGEDAVFVTAADAEFYLELTPQRQAMIPEDARLRVSHGDHQWDAVVGPPTEAPTGVEPGADTVFRIVTAPDGTAFCGADCAALPDGSESYLSAEVELEPSATGPAVPVAAVHTRADGSLYVELEGGGTRDIEVIGSTEGIAVVSGLEVGERVLLFTDTSAAPEGEDGGGDQN